MGQSASNIRQRSTLAATMVLALIGGSASADDMCGNLDGDDIVDQPDLGILLSNYGCDDGDCWGDVDGDGDTDQADLAWFIIGKIMYDRGLQEPCAPFGTGSMELHLASVDSTSVGPGDDPEHPEFIGGVTHFTFDLLAEVSADNEWTTQSSRVELVADGVEFFNHIVGGDVEPNENLFPHLPSLEFDSFFASPPEFYDYIGPGFADGPQWSDVSVEAIWFKWWGFESFAYDYLATTQRLTLVIDEDSGIVPAAMPDDCTHDYAILARIETDATSIATGADFLHRKFLIVDLAQPTCPGDVDTDGDVDQSDLGALLGAYHRPTDDPLYDENADFDCDGDVDQSDLGTLLAAYGGDC
jgi:hypothetical protein